MVRRVNRLECCKIIRTAFPYRTDLSRRGLGVSSQSGIIIMPGFINSSRKTSQPIKLFVYFLCRIIPGIASVTF